VELGTILVDPFGDSGQIRDPPLSDRSPHGTYSEFYVVVRLRVLGWIDGAAASRPRFAITDARVVLHAEFDRMMGLIAEFPAAYQVRFLVLVIVEPR
jgi:hypothetical protein